MNRLYTTILASAGLLVGSLAGADTVLAKDPGGPGKGPPGQEQDKGAKDQKEKKAHKHAHKTGKALLGDKIKKDGKHNLGKLANRDLTADVKNGKVVDMKAGDLPVKRVKTKQKMAGGVDNFIRVASTGDLRLAQYYDDWYYGYCFDDGYDYYCYWYTADEVDYDDYEWDDYDPYY